MNCLRVAPLEFTFEPDEPVSFSRYRAGNIVRGMLGKVLYKEAPEEYRALFAPEAEAEKSGPSGFGNRPRPFVLRVGAIDGKQFETGQRFSFRVNTFMPAFEAFLFAFERMPWRLAGAVQRPYIEANLVPTETSIKTVRLRFLTPTELKSDSTIVPEPGFDVLIKRVRDRVSSLCAFYQEGAPQIDFRMLGERAGAVRMKSSRLEHVDADRRSGTTGRHHGIGGFVGEAEYEGDLAEFLPWLQAAQWTGVGRLTVWGNGEMATEVLT